MFPYSLLEEKEHDDTFPEDGISNSCGEIKEEYRRWQDLSEI